MESQTMDRILVLMGKTEPKDKMLKVLQYTAKLVAARLSDAELAGRVSSADKKLGSSRQTFRLMKILGELRRFQVARAKFFLSFTPENCLRLMRSIGIIIYFIHDHLFFLAQTLFPNLDKAMLKRNARKGRFWGLLCAVVADLMLLAQARRAGADAAEQKKLALGITRQTCDCLLALKWWSKWQPSETTAALWGLTSSLIYLSETWGALKK